MDLVQAIVYGVVQGLTEFLPISSTAHLRIVPALFGWHDPGAAFTAIIQLGTVAAVLIYFAKDLARAFGAWLSTFTGKKADLADQRLGWAVFVGTIPIVIVAVALKDHIETTFRSLYVIAVALIGMGLVMLVTDYLGKKRRTVKEVTVKDGIVVGLWQVLSLIPGMSRSGTTMSGSFLQGFDRPAAARFSFLLSVPSITAAGVYEAYSALKHPEASGGPPVDWTAAVVATIVSFFVGYAAIAFFIRYLQRKGLTPFVIYRVALGVLILVLLQVSGNRLEPQNLLPPAPSSSGAQATAARERGVSGLPTETRP